MLKKLGGEIKQVNEENPIVGKMGGEMLFLSIKLKFWSKLKEILFGKQENSMES